MKLLAVAGRAFVRVTGADSRTFLQGLVTNNLAIRESAARSPAAPCSLFAAFLNPQGRVLFDSIIHQLPSSGNGGKEPDNCLLIECDQRVRLALIDHLLKYKLRSRITIDAESTTSWHCWQMVGGSADDAVIFTDAVISQGPDPRLNSILGTRVITSSSAPPASWADSNDDGSAYGVLRYINGIGEGADDFPVGVLLPQESNFDLLNGIDYRKGCYVGQELVIRTHHRGVVRKRVVPVQLIRANEQLPTGTTTKSIKYPKFDPSWKQQSLPSLCDLTVNSDNDIANKSVGKLISTKGNLGLALVRLELFTDDDFRLKATDELHAKPFLPDWFSAKQQ